MSRLAGTPASLLSPKRAPSPQFVPPPPSLSCPVLSPVLQRIVGITVVFENSSNSPQYGFAKFLGDGRWVGGWVGGWALGFGSAPVAPCCRGRSGGPPAHTPLDRQQCPS